MVYKLYGVVSHVGESSANGHFVASCKSPVDNKWHRYSDTFVKPITNLQKEILTLELLIYYFIRRLKVNRNIKF